MGSSKPRKILFIEPSLWVSNRFQNPPFSSSFKTNSLNGADFSFFCALRFISWKQSLNKYLYWDDCRTSSYCGTVTIRSLKMEMETAFRQTVPNWNVATSGFQGQVTDWYFPQGHPSKIVKLKSWAITIHYWLAKTSCSLNLFYGLKTIIAKSTLAKEPLCKGTGISLWQNHSAKST